MIPMPRVITDGLLSTMPACKFRYLPLFENVVANVINPRHACTARVTVLGVCVSASLSVQLYSRTTGNKAAYERG